MRSGGNILVALASKVTAAIHRAKEGVEGIKGRFGTISAACVSPGLCGLTFVLRSDD